MQISYNLKLGNIEYLYNFSRNKQNFNSAKTAVLSYDLTNLTNLLGRHLRIFIRF